MRSVLTCSAECLQFYGNDSQCVKLECVAITDPENAEVAVKSSLKSYPDNYSYLV